MSFNVGIGIDRGKLRLILPRSLRVSSRYISTGLVDTPENYKRVQVVAWSIENDLRGGKCDIDSYKTAFRPTINTLQMVVNLVELWQQYAEFKQSQVAATTYRKHYQVKWYNHIKALPSHDLSDAVAIRNHIVKTKTPDTAKRLLTYLSACCRWAMKSELVLSNPFDGMASDIKVPKSAKAIDPFSRLERDSIIEAFSVHPYHHYYTNFVSFLFLTGCRPGEAVALRWDRVSSDCSVITFDTSYDSQFDVWTDTKTHRSRKFPCNQVLREILLNIRPSSYSSTSLVFPRPNGKPINMSKFTRNIWKGTSKYKGVVRTPLVERYRCPYNTRHTYITMALEAGVPVALLAKWVGNSPEVIMKHYAGTLVSMDSPVT
ncbi:hypothetical protein DSM106972_009280 [Dulcicalothrix desertica PCC 7102]|uniref:Tyr recombinase domain-containing protein n=1 Tax=Dulcicalothrix desertica PCC 7102 TaxID=232991 RepID=A0A433VS56_9CYAN|nr:tyrosine-type recombinase/integrase [Dulcicalothrix desertica]RUT08875.1 hypothetical protein DSM106972_009280 [Dulcicalothrix desertica PCC 7102]TWH44109.1 integrase [Dulcicalothrix desertica PCC 7102]